MLFRSDLMSYAEVEFLKAEAATKGWNVGGGDAESHYEAGVRAMIEGAVAQLVANGTYAEIAAKYPDIVNNLTLLG